MAPHYYLNNPFLVNSPIDWYQLDTISVVHFNEEAPGHQPASLSLITYSVAPSTMRIYLAGPDVFEQNPTGRGDELKVLCKKHGAEGVFPLDNEILDVEHGSIEQARLIREANMALITSCDAILANMTPFRGPSVDVGTAYEMGAGAALGKVVVAYSKDSKSYVEKVKGAHKVERADDGHLRDENGMSVEEFVGNGIGLVDNLMISCGVEHFCTSEEEAIKLLVKVLKSRSVHKA